MAAKLLTGADVNNQRIIGVASPAAGTDAVNRDYVDGVIRGLDWKQEVLAATTANIALATVGLAIIDGYQTVAGDRILVKDQTAAAENGIYTAAAGAWVRALDADSATELSGSTVTVQRGTINADRVYRVTADDPITLGTTAITTAQVGAGGTTAKTAGNGLTETGTTYDVVAGNGILVTADAVTVDPAVVARKVAANNAATTSTAVAHNFGHRDIHVQVFETASPFQEVHPDKFLTDLNTVTVTFATAPAAGAYRIVVQG